MTNDCTFTSGAVSITVTGINAADFIPSASTCTGALAPDATCTVSVMFLPSIIGNEMATLTAAANPGGTVLASLTGGGLLGCPTSVSPATFSFPSTCLGQVSTPQTFTFTNGGCSATGIPTVAMLGGDSAQFTVASACTAPVAVGSDCTVSVTFSPTAPGSFTSELQFTASPGGTLGANLAGTGLACVPMKISPASGAFGQQIPGVSSLPIEFTVTNQSSAAIGPVSNSFGGANAGDFTFDADTCIGATLAPDGFCTIAVTFSPSVTGPETATLTASAGTNLVIAILTGTGCAGPPFTSSPNPLDFGDVDVGQTSAPQTVTVTANACSSTTGPLTVTLGGIDAAQFAIPDGGDGCTTPLAAGASCAFSLKFTPPDAGVFSATAAIAAAPGGASVVTLSGTGFAP